MLVEGIKKVKNSIVAIGFVPTPGQVTIVGSGFSVSDDGKVLTVAHLFRTLNAEQIDKLMCMAMVGHQDKLESYKWLPIKLIKKEDQDDVALVQVDKYTETLLSPLKLGDAEQVVAGQDVYFTGFPYAARLINEGLGISLITTKGIISSVKRKGTDPQPLDWFIVDAISNPGNSGCPLIDVESNKVIGIMSISFRTKSKEQKYSDLDIGEPMHIAGAKPISVAKNILEQA